MKFGASMSLPSISVEAVVAVRAHTLERSPLCMGTGPVRDRHSRTLTRKKGKKAFLQRGENIAGAGIREQLAAVYLENQVPLLNFSEGVLSFLNGTSYGMLKLSEGKTL